MRARDNPFRVDRLHALAYRFGEGGWTEVLERFAALDGPAAVVGPRGHGKTTFLRELAGRLEAAGATVDRLRLRPEDGARAVLEAGRRLSELAPGRTLLVDGAGVLPRSWWRAARRRLASGAGVVATAHRRTAWPTLHRCETTPELLAELVTELRARPAAAEPDPRHLWQRHAGDLRAALRELYDLYGSSRPPAARSRSGRRRPGPGR